MREMNKYIVLLACFALPFSGMAQIANTETADKSDIYQEDFELWTSVSAYSKLGKGFRLTGEQGFRFSDNGTSISTTYTDLGLRYKINDYLKVVGTYRFMVKPTELRHRIQLDLGVSAPKINRFDFSYRTRIQQLHSPNSNPAATWRNKVSVSYDIKDDPITPFIAGEIFYDFHYTGNCVTRMRYTAGASLNLPNGQELSLAYRFEQEYNVVGPWRAHILSVNYDFKLKKLFKK